MKIVVTGGLGFIGSAVVRRLLDTTDHRVLNIDARTYAATEGSVAASVKAVADATPANRPSRYQFVEANIADGQKMSELFSQFSPDAVIHLAAETHVDRSIDLPAAFVETNIIGTFRLLEAALGEHLASKGDDGIRFLHVSTDEVFGSLAPSDPPFNELTPYSPRSPYSASKAASDHLVRAWYETYGLPVIITNCSNNYGPFQFPEKLIPLVTLKALSGLPIPVYGTGQNVRDWLHVDDHAAAIIAALEKGTPGETYTIGGSAERTNLDVVNHICGTFDSRLDSDLQPRGGHRSLIKFVEDRPGHDHRYAIDSTKATTELGWEPTTSFEQGLSATVDWYLNNQWWWEPLTETRYDGERLGAAAKP